MNVDGVEWKLKYKRLVSVTYQEFSQENQVAWSVRGSPDARMRTFQSVDLRSWKVQGIMYCRARNLFQLFQDVDFERRRKWDTLIAPKCETVVETFFTQTMGNLIVIKHADGHRLLWCNEDSPSNTWVVMLQTCPYRLSTTKEDPHWMAMCIRALDDDPEYGNRCYIRLMTHDQRDADMGAILEQLNVCEKFCRDPAKWTEFYSDDAMRKRDLERRI